MEIKVVPRADFKSNWVESKTILDEGEVALILNDKGYPYVPSMVIGDGKTRAYKCRMISPYAFYRIVKDDETGVTKMYLHKSKEDYKWLYRYVRERNRKEAEEKKEEEEVGE